MLGHFGAYLGEFLGAAGRVERVQEVLDAVDFSAVDAAARGQRGVAVVTAHFGNWELGALALGLHHPGAAVLVRRIGDAVLDDHVAAARGTNRILDVAEGPGPIQECLAAGGILAAAIDEPRDRGIPVRFLGRIVPFPSAFFRIVHDTGALVVPARCLRLEPGRIAVTAYPAIEGDSVQAVAQAVADRFSSWIREAPDQWVMMRPFDAGDAAR